MGYIIGAVKYYIGMLTSVWGIITAYLFAKGLFRPLDYVAAATAIYDNIDSPVKMAVGVFNSFFTTPIEAAKLVLVGLAIMTLLWWYGSVTS